MAKKSWLIFNPVAGQGDVDQDLDVIHRLLCPALDLHVYLTTPEKDADSLAHAALEDGAELVIASGGDGTLSAVAQVVAGTGIPLGIIPRGTANALAVALGLPQDLQQACKVILEGYVHCIDTARCNGRVMILLAGIGFEAEAIKQTSRLSKNRLGVLAYVLSGLKQLSGMSNFKVEIETEDQIIHCKAVAVTVANTAPPTSILAQGSAQVCPDDGKLDVTIVAASTLLEAVATGYHLLATAMRELPTERDNIGYLRCRKLRILTDPVQKVVVDGEVVETTPLEIECMPQSLIILAPQSGQTPEVPEEKLEGLPGLKVQDK